MSESDGSIKVSPTQNWEAERYVLSVAIHSESQCAEIREIIELDDFQFDAHQRIWRSLCAMRDAKKPVDFVTLAGTIKANGDLDDVGGVAGVAGLVGLGQITNGPRYAQLVRDASISRYLLILTNSVQKDIYSPVSSIGDVLDSTQQELSSLANKLLGDTQSVAISESVNEVMQQIDRRSQGEQPVITAAGYDELDKILCGGMRHGHLIILAARPSVGKTSLAVNLARNACDRGGSVLFISLEQSRDELTARAMACVSGVAGSDIMRGKPNPQAITQISKWVDHIRNWKWDTEDRPGLTASQIAAIARRTHRKHRGLDLLVVDYLNEIRPETRLTQSNRNEQLGAACRRLRECAKELKIPCVLLAQLNRQAAGDNAPPSLHHLRDSGEIEQIADVVMLLHREESPLGRPEKIRVIIAKHRNGPLGTVLLEHDAPRFRFQQTGF